MQVSLNLNQLDGYALCHVFKWLPPKDLANAASVCKLWSGITRDFSLWKPIVERKLSRIPIIPDTPYWKHYSQNARGMEFRTLRVQGGDAISAWGTTISSWIKPVGPPDVYDCVRTTTPHTGAINSFAIQQFGLRHIVITGSVDKTLKIFSSQPHTRTYRLVQSLEGHTSGIAKLTCVRNYLLSASIDGEACLWLYNTDNHRYTHLQLNAQLHSSGLKFLIPAAHIYQFISVGNSGHIKFWSVCRDTIKISDSIEIINEKITSLAYCHFKPLLLVGTLTGKILFFEKRDQLKYHLVKSIDAHEGGITAMTIVGRDEYLLTAGRDRRIRVWSHVSDPENTTSTKTIHTTEKCVIPHLCGTLSNPGRRLSRILYPAKDSLSVLSFMPNQIKKYTITAAEPHEKPSITTHMELISNSHAMLENLDSN